MKNPSHKEWSRLYELANNFKTVSPWNWMSNEDLFAVVNPENGEVGYCSVLGSGGEEFGLGVFLGTEGYMRCLRLMYGEQVPEEFDETVMTPMLSLLFTERGFMQKQDLEVIKSLGLKYRGRNAWPQFRSQRPGFAPWFLDREEARFLTVVLEQSLIVAEKVRSNSLDIFEDWDDDLVFTRSFGDGEWEDSWADSPRLQQSEANTKENKLNPINLAETLLIRDSMNKPAGTWELDIFIMPIPIGTKSKRPYFPLSFLAVERNEGIVIATEMTEPWITIPDKQGVVIKILKNAGQLPRSILVKSEKIKDIVEPVTSQLGINLRIGSTPMLEEFKASLDDYLSNGI